jgi:hypothetical protein
MSDEIVERTILKAAEASQLDVAVINLRGIPRDLKNSFKSTCAAGGTDMTSVLIHAMAQVVSAGNVDGFVTRV